MTEPGAEWPLDTIGPLEEDDSGNKYILSAVCGFTRRFVIEGSKVSGLTGSSTVPVRADRFKFVWATQGNPD